MVVMSDPMKKYIVAKDKKGYNKSQNDGRIILRGKRGLEDLTFFLNNLPEETRREIFNRRNLGLFFHALFTARPDEELSEDKRLRLLDVCNAALEQISVHNNGPQLARDAWKVLSDTTDSSQDQIYGSKVILALQIQSNRFVGKKE